MKEPLFTGCATALITPFCEQGIDETALRKLVDRQIKSGVSALVACGTTGEPTALSPDEWTLVIKTVVEEAAGRVPVIAGTGGNNTQTVISLAKKARELGASAQLCVTPYYNKTSQEGLIAHYRAIDAAGDLPFILYNVPSRTGLCVNAQTLQKISRLKGLIGVKEASADLCLLGDMMQLCGQGLAFYSGSDEVTVPIMSLGGLGVISVLSNVLPQETVEMTEAMRTGDLKRAAQLQLHLLPLIHALFSQVNPIPVKAALALMGQCENRLRLPLVPLPFEKETALLSELRKWGVA